MYLHCPRWSDSDNFQPLSLSLSLSLCQTNQLIAKLLEEKQIEQALKHSQIKQHTCAFNKQDSSNIMFKTKDELASLGNTETTAKDYTMSTNEAVSSLKHQLSTEFEDFLLSNDQSPSYLRTNLIDLSEEVKLVSSTKWKSNSMQLPSFLTCEC